MSIWGLILGGAAGFALGGPLGALIGAAAGHAVDRVVSEPDEEAADATQRIAFTIGVIVLGAKMAKIDGWVTRDEINAFKEVFRVPPEEMRNVGRLFDLARRDAQGFEPYARQLARLLHDRRPVLEELLDGLFHIAQADGALNAAELRFLGDVAAIFGFSAAEFDRIKESHGARDTCDPYAVLGLSRTASDAEVKTAYRRLAHEYHPDRLIAQGVPREFIDVANAKMAAINAAYERIRKQRARPPALVGAADAGPDEGRD